MAHGYRTSTWRVALLAAAAWLLPATAGAQEQAPIQRVTCSFSNMLDELRAGLKTGSPAYRKYLLQHIKEAARSMPPGELIAAVEQERDPAVLEALGAALATHAGFTEDTSVLQPLLKRAAQDADPAARAAAVRGLRGTGSVETMSKNGNTVTYEQLIRDPSPEVREAVVGNLTDEAARNFGRFQGVAEQAVALASEASDPKTAAGLLGASSIESARTPAVDSVRQLLEKSEHPEVRAAAAKALGTVQVGETERTMKALTERFATEGSREVRGAILEGIARLGLSGAVPVLQKLKGADPAMDGEIDTWLTLLASQPQTWELLLRDKQARELAKNQGG